MTTPVGLTPAARARMHSQAVRKPLDVIIDFRSCLKRGVPGGPTVEQSLQAFMQIGEYLAHHPDFAPSKRKEPRVAHELNSPVRYGLLVEIDRSEREPLNTAATTNGAPDAR